jgi:sugar O-acyltransferase (sialic acid O-acetyltransferase NeuD family)
MKNIILSIPQENPNDEFITVLGLEKNGTKVASNKSVILEFETSKAIVEEISNHDGFFYTDVEIGNKLKIGYKYAIISETELTEVDWRSFLNQSRLTNIDLEEKSDQIITKPAIQLIEKHNIPIEYFKGLTIVTKENCEEYLKSTNKSLKYNIRQELSDKQMRVAIIGAGTGASIATDILLKSNEYQIAHYYDDSLVGSKIFGFDVRARISIENIINDYRNGLFDEILITLGSNPNLKDEIFKKLDEAGLKFANAIHPSVIIARGVNVGVGNIIAANTVIGVFASIGSNNFISSACVIEHHNLLGNSNSFGPGVQTSGTVRIGDRIKFGTGIFIEPYLEIGNDCIISSGSIITKSIPSNHTLKFISNSKLSSNS